MLQIDTNRLRIIEKKDLNFLKNLRLSEFVQRHVGQRIFLNDDLQEKWYDKILQNSTVFYGIFDTKRKDGYWLPTGYVRITEIDHFNKSMMIGADLHENFRNKGYGKIVYKLMFELGFKHWGMNRLYLLVLESNIVARALYEKVGLKVEGIQRKAIFKNGKYEDYIMMSILKEEYV